ncbi:amino acid ABC transporter permease [Undibacter mobilis]|uniref:Amino acid ABC transporter permease n=1 Tax=Undibacter mobilis TaxID=2292256 RepID=A0A371BBG0_9BRAD|nr:amino acid ABC transporter permease [Undibacter mobilis]RDV04691.1 amino acid ABC transporter permease [Undibacter mobilis]
MNMGLLAMVWLLLKGFMVSLQLAAGVLILGTVFGFLLGIAGARGSRVTRSIIHGLVVIVRGVPLLIQVFAVFYFLPLVGPTLSPFLTATVALSLFAAVTIGEIVRGSIVTVPAGQWEAARALGLGRLHTLVLVVLPEALPTIIPSLVGQFVWLIKGTSIISLLGVPELMYAGHQIIERTLRGFEVMALIWIIYTAVCYPLSVLGRYLEARLKFPDQGSALAAPKMALAGDRV